MNLRQELSAVQFAGFNEIFEKFRKLSDEYGGLPAERIISAFTRATGGTYALNNPYIQNRRVKQISSLPVNYTKDKVVEMITAPISNEKGLRQVGHALEWTAYPLYHMRRIYQDLLTYHSYIVPRYVDKSDTKTEAFKREWRLLEKLKAEIDPKSNAHKIVGQAIVEGKVFYYPRVSVDKPHNKVNYAFMQQLPSDWTKIVGFNNKSKYTVAFNMFYFMQPGTDPEFYGDLFTPYMQDFYTVTKRGREKRGDIVYASKGGVNMAQYNAMRQNGPLAGDPDVYYQNGRWFYWVTLPVDKIYTFEVDDANVIAASPFAGLYISMIQIAQYEQVQLEIVQNPLIACLTGEVPYRDDTLASSSDPYKLSYAGIRLFEDLWYQMMSANNTSGIGIYMAPLQNMKLHTLGESPSATDISESGYAYTISKAGLSAIIPTSKDPKSGAANISLKVESGMGKTVYRDFSRMMDNIFASLNLNYEWHFEMFGSVADDEKDREELRKDMTLGILPSTARYMALNDMSLLDDMSLSAAIMESGVLDLRVPLVSSYSAKQGESGLPPQAKHDLNPGGREESGDSNITSDGHEVDVDQGQE